MSRVKSKKICVDNFEKETIYTFTIGGVHFCTKECRINLTAKVYSHKFHGPGIVYEVEIAIYKDHVLWIKGPFFDSTNDATMFQSEGGLHPYMPQGKRGIADSAYRNIGD